MSILGASNVRLWLRSDLGLTPGGGSEVAARADQSGNGNHATQGTASLRPLLTSGVDRYDGVDDRLVIADANSLDLTTSMIFAMRVNPSSLAGANIWMAKSPASTAGAWWVQYSAELRFGFGVGIATNAPAGAFTAGQWHTIVMAYDGGGADNTARGRWWVNGAQQTCTFYGVIPATMTVDAQSVTIGAFNDGTSPASIGVSEIVIASGVPTAAQVAALTSLLTLRP